MLTKIALLSLLATLVAGDHVTKDEKGADSAPDTVPGYMLVYQKGYCGSLGKDLGRDIFDPNECFRLAQGLRATAFSMGRKYRKGRCSVELLEFTCSNYEQWQEHPDDPECPDAWSCANGQCPFHDSRYYDWYALEPQCDQSSYEDEIRQRP